MGHLIRVAAFAMVLSCAVCPDSLQAQVNVTTYHNDNARTGQNTRETTLSPTNVNSNQFGKLFTTVVDGYVYAQPLYLSNVSIQGGTHNVLYVATEHNSVYAIDADSGAIYWQVSLTPAGGTTISITAVLKCGDLSPEAGISGTPVIDINSGILYVVAGSVVNGAVVQYLHAIDVRSATEKFGGPVLIHGSAPGTATDGNGTTVTFNALYENQRAGLLLEGGHVVIAWASHCDVDPWHGWVMSYNAGTLAQEGVFNPSADGRANGVWMTGGGPAADANGNVFFATGTGTWNGTTDYGDSILYTLQSERPFGRRHGCIRRRAGSIAGAPVGAATACADGQRRQDLSGRSTQFGEELRRADPRLQHRRYANRAGDPEGKRGYMGLARLLERKPVLGCRVRRHACRR
jgi:hypothetical protein